MKKKNLNMFCSEMALLERLHCAALKMYHLNIGEVVM